MKLWPVGSRYIHPEKSLFSPGVLRSVCDLVMLWLAGLYLCLCAQTLALPVPARRPSDRTKLLLVSFDGFRWDYDRDVDTPHLDAMAREGVKATYVTPPFLTVTSPTHFTILTGKYIENHGVIHNMWFDTSTLEKKSYYNSQFVNDWWDNGSLPIWMTAQRQGLKTGSLHFPGTASTYQGEDIFKREVEPKNYNYSNETAWRDNVDKIMGLWFGEQDLEFVSMYFGEPDSTGHKYGPDSPERREMVKQVDRTIGYMRSSAERHGLKERLNIIITSDHGMSTVYRNGLVEEIVLSKIPGFSFRVLAFHIVDFGPAGMLLPKEGRMDKVYNALKGAHPHLHVYKKEEMPAHLHYSNNNRILPIILWADPGYVINGYLPLQFHKGEHGYDNQALDMKPFFRAVGPDFRKDLEVGPFETVNIYPLMCHLLGITPEPNDGNLDITRHMLTSSVQPEGKNSSDTLTSVFTGLGAAAGFLVIVFVVWLSYGIHKRRKNKNSVTDNTNSDDDETETKQTVF